MGNTRIYAKRSADLLLNTLNRFTLYALSSTNTHTTHNRLRGLAPKLGVYIMHIQPRTTPNTHSKYLQTHFLAHRTQWLGICLTPHKRCRTRDGQKKIVAQIPMHKICRDPGNDSRCLCYMRCPPPGKSLRIRLFVSSRIRNVCLTNEILKSYSLGSDSSQLDLLCKRATTNIIRRVASITRHCIDAMVRLLYCFSCYRGCSRFCLSRRD